MADAQTTTTASPVATTKPSVTTTFSEPVRLYRVLPNVQYYIMNNPVLSGDEVYLTERQASAFRDKFEPVDPKGKFEARKGDPNEPLLQKVRARELAVSVVEPPVDATKNAVETDEKDATKK